MSDRVPVLLIVTLVCSLATSPVVASGITQSDTVELTVDVDVIERSAPEEGTRIVADWDQGNSTQRTKSNGRVRFTVPRGSNVTLDLATDQYVINRPVNITNLDSDRRVSMAISRPAELNVELRRIERGATVRLSQNSQIIASGTTGRNGRWNSGPIERGSYTFRVSKPGYYNASRTVGVKGTTNERIGLREGSSALRFEVRDTGNGSGRPVANATVVIDGDPIGNTSVAGTVGTELPVNQRVTVTVTKPGYASTSFAYRVPQGDRTVVVNLSLEPELRVMTADESVVTGETTTVSVADAYGAPVAGAEILLNNRSVARTNSNGTAAVRISDRGRNQIVAETNTTTSEPLRITGAAVPATATATTSSETASQTGTTQPGTPAEGTPFISGGPGSTIFGVGIGTLLTSLGLILTTIVGLSLFIRRRR